MLILATPLSLQPIVTGNSEKVETRFKPVSPKGQPASASFSAAGAPAHLLETWFAQTLRDAFALDAVGIYQPFAAIAAATLRNLVELEREEIEHIVSGFGTYPPVMEAPDVTVDKLEAGVREFLEPSAGPGKIGPA